MRKHYIDIHNLLHDLSVSHISLNNISYKVTIGDNGCRNVIFIDDWGEWEIIQQNPATKSAYARRVKDGEKISWLIPRKNGYKMSDGWKVITPSTQTD